MPIYLLKTEDLSFPHPEMADDSGILAIGGDLAPDRLILAYKFGIFPWYNEGEPIVWWTPNPRFVLFPEKLKVAKSMRPYFNQKKFHVTFDQQFRNVVKHCAKKKRNGQAGTWITLDMMEAYSRLHDLGYAHSVEVWENETLVGGLYGLSFGKIFYGESMFSRKSNASKFGFISLIVKLKSKNFKLIDCQQETQYLGSLGAEKIERSEFMKYLRLNALEESLKGNWQNILGD